MPGLKPSLNSRCLLSWLCLALFLQDSKGQIDTEFWFAAPSVTEDHGDRPIVFRLAAFEKPAAVQISQPANPSFTPITTTVNANESRTIDVSFRVGAIENWPANKVLDKGIHITANAPITAYYEVNSDVNPDIFSLKGRNALGKEFFIPAQNFWPNAHWYVPQATSTADIVATEHGTRVTITPSVRTKTHSAGQTFTITLDRGQTYSLAALSHEVAHQLTGTTIQADKLIAITLKDDSNEFRPCLDLGGDQLVPVDVLGTEYIVVKGFLDGGDHIFVQAIEDGTTIKLNGNRTDVQLDRGEMHDFRLSTDAAHLQSNNPIYVVHGTGFGCETGLAILPKLACTGSQSVNFTRSTVENFGIILITEDGNQDAFSLNGNEEVITPADFKSVAGAEGRYVAARIDLTNRPLGSRALNVKNSKGSFHLGTINGGYRTGCRYGYFSDFKTLKILADGSKICLGSELELRASGSDQLRWFGEPSIEGVQSASITVAPAVSTRYGVIGSNGLQGCVDTAYLKVEVFEWPKPSIEISNPCVNQEVRISYRGQEELARIDWILNGDTITTAWQEDLILYPTETQPINLTVLAITPAGCLVDTTYHFDVGGLVVDLDSAFNVTRGEERLLNPTITQGSLDGGSFEWFPPNELSCTDCLSPAASPIEETTYQLKIRDSTGCVYLHEVQAFVDAPIFLPNAFTPNHDDANDTFKAFTSEDVLFDQLHIFNRWGSLVFQSDDPRDGWDGLIQGTPAPEGTYIYTITGRHLRSGVAFTKHGTVHLLR